MKAAYKCIGRYTICITAAMLLALLFSHAAYAEEISTDFQNMLTEGKQYSEVFRTMTPASFLSRAADIAFPGIRAAMLLAQKILIYLLFAGGVYILATQPTRQYLGAVPALGFAAVLLPDIINLLADLAAHSESWSRYLMVMVPMLSGLTAAVGYTGTALVYSGSFVGCACLFAAAIRLVLLPVLRLYLAIALTGAIWKRNSLCEAADLFLRILKMAFQGLAVLLGILLGAQSVLAQSADSLALKTGKFLLASSIPIVGQTASDALGTVVAGMKAAKSYLAFAAMGTVLIEFLPVFCQAVCSFLALYMGAVLAASLGLSQIQKCLLALSEAVHMYLAVIAIFFLLVFFSTVYMVLVGG